MGKKDCIKEVIELVQSKHKAHQALAKLLELLLHNLFFSAPKVEARTKAVGSIAGKILKKYIQLKDPVKIYAKLTDLVGARVIFLRKDKVVEADSVIRTIFYVDDQNSQDVGERLSDSEFGYQSQHYTVICNKKWIEELENNVLYNDIAKKISENEKKNIFDQKKILSDFFVNNPDAQLYAELQIRTWLQHVWADLTHDDIYKGDREIPREIRRFWSSIAAVLENTDDNIVACLKQLEKYNTNGTYYNKNDLKQKIENLEIINEFLSSKDYEQDDFQKKWATETLEKNQKELERLRNLQGNTETKQEQYIQAQKIDVQVLEDELAKDSTNPRSLLYYLTENKKLICHDIILTSLLKAATKRCDEMITSSLELPWAFAGKAFFLLFLNSNATAEITIYPDLPEDKKEEIRVKKEIIDSILRLIDLCNERSVANLGDDQLVATKDSKEALITLKKSVETIFKSTNKQKMDVASLVECVKQLLSLGVYSHLEQKNKPSPNSPAVIIAGGCESLNNFRQELDEFKKLFKSSLECGTQKITFLTGGGTSGICSLDFLKNHVVRFGISSDENVNKQNQSSYKEHSIFEALLEWKHLQKKHYRFEDVALVGYGLSDISNYECRIALALGARVTVLRHKNFLSNDQIFCNIAYWSKHPSLIDLPLIRNEQPQNKSFKEKEEICSLLREFKDIHFPEPVMLRVFMLFKPYHKEDYAKKEVDPVVLLIHRIKRLKTEIQLLDLKDLEPLKKLSEQHRLLFFETLCKDVSGLQKIIQKEFVIMWTSVKKLHSKIHPCMTLENIKDYLKQIPTPELLNYAYSEREHARWYIERWLQGTRYGANKIDKNVLASQMKNPCMVAWYDLNDDTILKDTEFLNRYIVAKAVNTDEDIVKEIKKCFMEKTK